MWGCGLMKVLLPEPGREGGEGEPTGQVPAVSPPRVHSAGAGECGVAQGLSRPQARTLALTLHTSEVPWLRPVQMAEPPGLS